VKNQNDRSAFRKPSLNRLFNSSHSHRKHVITCAQLDSALCTRTDGVSVLSTSLPTGVIAVSASQFQLLFQLRLPASPFQIRFHPASPKPESTVEQRLLFVSHLSFCSVSSILEKTKTTNNNSTRQADKQRRILLVVDTTGPSLLSSLSLSAHPSKSSCISLPTPLQFSEIIVTTTSSSTHHRYTTTLSAHSAHSPLSFAS